MVSGARCTRARERLPPGTREPVSYAARRRLTDPSPPARGGPAPGKVPINRKVELGIAAGAGVRTRGLLGSQTGFRSPRSTRPLPGSESSGRTAGAAPAPPFWAVGRRWRDGRRPAPERAADRWDDRPAELAHRASWSGRRRSARPGPSTHLAEVHPPPSSRGLGNGCRRGRQSRRTVPGRRDLQNRRRRVWTHPGRVHWRRTPRALRAAPQPP
jgi:hypothetical protein